MGKISFYKGLKKLTQIVCLGAFFTPLITSLSACSDDVIKLENIEIVKDNFWIENRQFSVPFIINDLENIKEVSVQLDNPDKSFVNILTPTVEINGSNNNVQMFLSDEVHSDYQCKFGLIFTYKLKDQTLTNNFNDLQVHFQYTPEVKKDEINITNKYLENDDNRHFDFHIIASKRPIDGKINIFLRNDITGSLYLSQHNVTVQPFGQIYDANFGVNVNNNIDHSQTFTFNITLQFINSYNVVQSEQFLNCSIKLNINRTKYVPTDYFDIRQVGNEQRLFGLKTNISPSESAQYVYLSIPEGVTQIVEEAFSDKEWFSKIRYIKIPGTVSVVGKNAFSGCTKTFEIDLTEYKSFPEWFKLENPVFTNEGQPGYVWSSGLPDPDEFDSYMTAIGLTNDWKAFDKSVVVPDDFFVFDENDKGLLKSFDPEKALMLRNYKVIRLPDKTTSIEKDAFDALKDIPFIHTKEGQPNRLETRRLILNEKLTTLPEGCFEGCGISGPIIFYCYKIHSIPDRVFQNAQYFAKIDRSLYYTEKNQIVFNDCNEITYVGVQAFNFLDFDQTTFVLPHNLSFISEWAFQGNKFNKIVFQTDTQYLGNWSFANDYTTSPPKALTCLDLSRYNKPINPKAPPEEQTFFPNWFSVNNKCFENSCADTGQIILSQECWDEAHKTDWEEWCNSFREHHSIPSGWEFLLAN